MILKAIDKARYRKHLNIVFAVIALSTLLISLGISTLLIEMLSRAEESHFYHNIAGAIIAVTIVFYTLHKFRHHEFMEEVTYVWDLKQQLNKIYRKQHKIEAALESNNPNAMIIINFQNHGSKQLYELDDNTITMDELADKILQHNKHLDKAGLPRSTDNYNPALLDEF